MCASQNDTSTGGIGNFATAFDDFTLGSTATITNVAWTGAYYNPQTQGTITGFTLQIYSDKSGVPGASLYSVTVPGTANETSLGSPGGLGLFFSYNASVNFAATGGVEYWLSLVPDLGFPPQWGWATGTGGTQPSYEIFMVRLVTSLVHKRTTLLSRSRAQTPPPRCHQLGQC